MIGSGASGKVYKAIDSKTNKKLAIKMIPISFEKLNELKEGKESETNLIEREVNVMRELKHENIVAFYGYQRSIKYRTVCILMEYVKGNSIDILYKHNGRFTETMIRIYTKQMLSALCYAHKKKIIHRDIKGKNILVTNNGIVKLADFGSSKLTDSTTGKNSISLNYNYTPLWMAPEVITTRMLSHSS